MLARTVGKRTSMNKPRVACFRTVVPVGLVLLAGAALLPCMASAQSLDEQYAFLLNAKCRNMSFARGAGQVLLPGQAGPALTAYCNGPVSVPDGATDSYSATAGVGVTTDIADQAARRRKAAAGNGDGADEVSLFSMGQYSVFGALGYSHERQDARRFEGSRRSDTLQLTLGLDRRMGTAGVVGIAALAEDLQGDLEEGGRLSHSAFGGVLYGSWLLSGDSFIDLATGWMSRDVETSRVVALRGLRTFDGGPSGNPPPPQPIVFIPPARATGDVGQQDWLAELRAGHDFRFGRYTVGPRLAASWRRAGIDGATEAGTTPMTLVVDKQTEKSLRTAAGVQASRVFNTDVAVWVVQLNTDWWHEFQDDQRFITARLVEDLRPEPSRLRYQNQPPDRDVYTARFSLTATLPHGWSAFASVDALLGHAYLNRYGAALGLRKEL
jgi:hypothetical protein